MKINVTVDLSDFYSDDDELSFTSQIKQQIVYEVKNSVLKDFRDKAYEEVSNLVRNEFNQSLKKEIGKIVTKVFKESKVKKRNNSNELTTYFEFIESEMANSYERPDSTATSKLNDKFSDFKNKYDKEISLRASEIVTELKERYDVLFASQIVSKLGENGLMNSDAVKLLLDK